MSPRGRYALRMSLLVGVLFLAYLAGNGRVPLFDRDEPRYALASLEMLQSGDWVVPRLLGEVRTAKPPAIYWLQAGAMRLFGPGEFAVRLPGAISCAATVTLMAITLPPLIGRRRAAWAAFTFGTSVLVLGVAKVGVIDGVLVLCAAAMQIALLRMIRSRGGTLGNAVLLWTAVALGGLLKGPVILGVLLATLLVEPVVKIVGRVIALAKGAIVRSLGAAGNSVRSRFRDTNRRCEVMSERSARTPTPGAQRTLLSLLRAELQPLLGLTIILLICAPWLILVSMRAPGFLTTALAHDVATRSVRGLEGHGQPPGFHLLALFGTWFPWSVLLPATLLWAWRRRGDVSVRLALAACVGPWVMFEIVVTKLPHYLLVIFPMLAVLTAGWIARWLRRLRLWRVAPPATKAAAVVYAVVAAGFVAAPVILNVSSWPFMVLAGAWGAALAALWWTKRLRPALLTAGLGVASLAAVAYLCLLGRAPALTLPERTAEALERVGAREAALVHYREPSLAWYAQRRGIHVFRAEEPWLAEGSAFALSTRRRLGRVPQEVSMRWEVIAEVEGRLYNDELRSDVVLVLAPARNRQPTSTPTD